jgi:carboxypeptidase family protein
MKNKVLEVTFLAFGAVGVLGATSLLAPTEAHAQASSTVGTLRGGIKDKTTGESAIGATVVATSPALVGEQVVITDESGLYFINSLPPGLYTLTIYYENKTFSRANVLIQVGKEAVVNVTVDPKQAGTTVGKGTEIIEVSGSVPIIDQGSTKTGVTLTDDYTRNIPTGRTFGGVLGSAAGSQNDIYGTSISGATSAENTYIVEGINTTDTGFGGLSSNLPNEFIQETEVITGGYNAEFGRATGGIVNVVTKQGSNEFHGSVYGYVKPGQFVSAAKTIVREGSSIDSATDLDYNYDLGAEVGGPIIKDKLWFHVGFNPSFSKFTTTRKIQRQVDQNNDGVPDVDPETGFIVHENVSNSEIPTDFATYFFTAKINGAINQNNQFQISAFGNPGTANDIFRISGNPSMAKYKDDQGAYDVSAKYTSKFNEGKTQLDAVVGYHRGYETQAPFATQEDVPLAFERANHARGLFDFAADADGIPGEGTATIAGCNDADPNNPYPMLRASGSQANRLCPTLGYAWQGLGFLEKRINDRTSAVLSLTQRVKAAGYHTFKVGVDAEFATYNSNRHYTGGQLFRHNTLAGTPSATSNGAATWQLREFQRFNRNLSKDEIDALAMDPNAVTLETNQILCANGRAICETTPALNADTNNTGLAAYIQDSWQIVPNFTINAGLRWEQQTGYVAKALQGKLTPTNEVIPDEAYKLNNLLAPRVGFIYDPTKEGKSKIFGHFGRFYENVPMDLNVRSFGGEITNFVQLNAHKFPMGNAMFDANCVGDYGTPNLTSNLAQCKDRVEQVLIGEGVEFVAPNLQGQYTQEVILCTEYEVYSGLKFGLSYIHRTMPQVIEDISTDGGNNYLIANPSNDFQSAANDLHKQSTDLLASGNCMDFQDASAGCDKDKRDLAALIQSRSDQLAFVKKFDKPVRNYDALQLTAQQRPTKNSLLVASYTFSQSKGNYPGLFSTETGQLDPNITSLYDLPDLMANRYGPLGLDRPHNFKVDGFYRFDLKKAGALTTGASFRAQSGLAHNVLGASPHPGYGAGESYVLGRGQLGRSPVTSQMDVHLSYGYQLNKTTFLEGFVNVFNLFNQQEELGVDENYTFDFTNPIVGGDLKDAAHAKVLTDPLLGGGGDTNTTVNPNKNFSHTSARQAPRNVQLGVRLTF